MTKGGFLEAPRSRSADVSSSHAYLNCLSPSRAAQSRRLNGAHDRKISSPTFMEIVPGRRDAHKRDRPTQFPHILAPRAPRVEATAGQERRRCPCASALFPEDVFPGASQRSGEQPEPHRRTRIVGRAEKGRVHILPSMMALDLVLSRLHTHPLPLCISRPRLVRISL